MWGRSKVLHGCLNQYNSEFKKVIDNMTSFRNDQYLWWQVAEYTYDGFVAEPIRIFLYRSLRPAMAISCVN